MKALARFAVGGLLLLLLLILAGAGTLIYLNSPSPRIPREGRLFRVVKGETVGMIAVRLQQERLIRSSLLLVALSHLAHSQDSFKTGYFRIVPGDTTLSVHQLLISGYQEQIKVTIPEGWTIGKIAGFLESREVCTKQEIVDASRSRALLEQFGIPADSFEGYLCPDTYFFPKGYPPRAIIEQMAMAFFSRLEEVEPGYKTMDRSRLHEKVILASIVEREYRIAEEAPLIASVFYNRLKANIGLESCATLEYIITEIQEKPHPKLITQEDKRIDSPYNTYKWAGLPPGPISNPGMVALRAAFRPPKTDYWYFVLKDAVSGEHFFSQSLKEHNRAKHSYLKQVGTGS